LKPSFVAGTGLESAKHPDFIHQGSTVDPIYTHFNIGGIEMVKAMTKMSLAVLVLGLLVSGAYAGPISLNATQMDSVAAGGVEKVDGFVCPVIKADGVLNNPHAKAHPIADGYNTVVGPKVSIPVHATNQNGNGRPGVPGGFAAPGDRDYTAVWGFRP